jgi:WD40 repeat protein/uncharacterized caspase-like protein
MARSLTRFVCLTFALLAAGAAAGAERLDVVVQSGHPGLVEKVAFSADGEMLASADSDGRVKLWDLTTYKEIRTINTGLGQTAAPPNALSFSPDGKLLFLMAADRSAFTFEVESGRLLSRFEKNGRFLNLSGADAHGGKLLGAQLTDDGRVRVISLKTGGEVFVFGLPAPGRGGGFAELRHVTFSPDGRTFAAAAEGGGIALADAAAGRLIRVFRSGEVSCLAFSEDGGTLAAFEQDAKAGTLLTLRATAGALPERVIRAAAGEAVSLALSPDARTLAGILKNRNGRSGEDEYVVKLWDAATGRELRAPEADPTPSLKLTEVRFSPDGRTLAVAAGDVSYGRVHLCDVETGREVARLQRQSAAVSAVRYLKNGQLLAEATTTRLWDLKRGTQVGNHALAEHAFSSDGKLLAVYDTFLGTFKIVEPETGNQVAKLDRNGFDATSSAVTFSPDDRLLLVLASPTFNPRPADRLMLFDAATGRWLFTLPDNAKVVAFSPDAKLLAYGVMSDEKSRRFAARVWDVERREELRTVELRNEVKALAFDPAGSRLAVASYLFDVNKPSGYFLNVYGVRGREPDRSLGEQGVTDALAFSPDGALLAGGSSDEVKLWNTKAEEVGVLAGHDAFVSSLAFSPDGKTLASGGLDGQIIFWDYKERAVTSRLVVVGDADYVFVTPEGYYLTSRRGAAAAVAFRRGARALPFEQFDIRFNRPDLVVSTLGAADAGLVEVYAAAHRQRLRQYGLTDADLRGELRLPKVSVATRAIPSVTKRRELRFHVGASDDAFALMRLNVYVNDVPVYGAQGLDLGGVRAQTLDREVGLELSPGGNRVQVSVVNKNGVESIRQTFGVIYEGAAGPPSLYVLAVGVAEYSDRSLNLTYPAKDAEKIVRLFEGRAAQARQAASGDARRPGFQKVYSLLLTDADATVERITAAHDFLERAQTDDEVVVFISGHGVLDKDKNYFFATRDIDFDNPAERGLSYAALEKLLDNLRARRKLVLIDTCHAGEVEKGEGEGLKIEESAGDDGVIKSLDVRPKSGKLTPAVNSLRNSLELVGELFADLRLGSGASVVSASGGLEYAYESPQWSGGVFTYAVRLGLEEMRADANEDGAVSASELRDFVRAKVPELTKGRQRPTFRYESVEFDFPIY